MHKDNHEIKNELNQSMNEIYTWKSKYEALERAKEQQLYELERAKEQEMMKVNQARQAEELRRLKEQFDMDKMNWEN